MINNDVNPGKDKSSEEYINAFERFDKDYDGYMSIDDLAEIMKKVGKSINQGEMQDLKGEINPHENGMFDLKEYLSIMQRRKKDKDCDEDLLVIFKIIDKDENDLIGPDELLNFMSSLEHKVSQEETEEMIKEFDSDGDGYCTFKEFVKMIKYQNEEEEVDDDKEK